MAGQDDGPGATGRGPKYRTSCDNCQAAKVKCGQEKPSCRRCSVHKFECVYSLSRRMGRPRAKKSVSEDSARGQSNVGSDDNIRSKPATPAAGFAESETTVAVRRTPVLEAGASEPLLSEPNQIQDPWTPLVGDFEPPNVTKVVDDPNLQPMTNSLDFLPTDTPMELDEVSRFLAMPSFLEDLSSSTDSQRPISTPSADLFEPRDLLSTRLPPATNEKGPSGSIHPQPSLQQRYSNGGSAQYLGRHSDRFSQAESAPSSSNAAPSNQMFDYSFEFLSDMGRTSQDACSGTLSSICTWRHGGPPACPRTIATLKPSPTHLGSEEDSRVPSRRRAPADRKGAHCNCISTISQCVVSLRTEQQKKSSVSIDCALMVESKVEESLSRLYRCKNCCHESTVHLLALVSVRMMLDLLQKTARDEFASRPRRSSDLVDSDILWIGNFKVTPRARFRFLRRLLQARFYRLAVLVEEREKFVDCISQDCFTSASSLLLGDITRGLRTIMGWLELWNSKSL